MVLIKVVCVVLVDGPKHSIAMLYTVSRRVIHTASTSCSAKKNGIKPLI